MFAPVLEIVSAHVVVIDCPACEIEMDSVQLCAYSTQHSCGNCGYTEER